MAKVNIEQGKALISSRTFWFNVLFGLVAIAGIFGFSDFQPDQKTAEVVGIVAALINILLRLKTSKPITKLN